VQAQEKRKRRKEWGDFEGLEKNEKVKNWKTFDLDI
jgi:hypothetical protein